MGASTKDILCFSISLLKVMNSLDESGCLLLHLIPDIRKYLSGRKDTISIIVKDLSEDDHFALKKEIKIHSAHEASSVDEWNPSPLEAHNVSFISKVVDSMNLLISLFESKELFIAEFEKNLSTKLSSPSCDLEKEVKSFLH